MNKKIIIIAQAIFLILIVIVIYSISPRANYPRNNIMTGHSVVEFRTDNADIILIDDNPYFSSAIEVNLKERNNTKIRLEPGTYYWKAVGVLESSVKKFTIISKVSLELENSTLKNEGDVALNIIRKTDEESEDLVILEVSANYILNNTDEKIIYQGEQYEE